MSLLLVFGCVPQDTALHPTDPPVADTPAFVEDTAPVDTGDTGDTAELPGEYIYDADDDLGNLLTVEEVAASLEEGVGALMSEMNPFMVLAALDSAVAASDSTCPYHYTEYEELYGYDYWYGGCTTAEGSTFTGSIYGIHYDPFWSSYYYYPDYGWWYGDVAIDRADGQGLELAGSWSMYRYEIQNPAQSYLYVSAYGEPRWVGSDYGDTWLGRDPSLSYTMTGGSDPQLGAYTSIDGGLSGLDGAASSIWFDGVYMATARWGSSCALEPSGTVSIRDAAGDWYDVDFQGPAFSGATSFPAECDGCGDVWFRGEPLGQACADLSALTGWMGSPW
jgi:hypothetical protein